MVIKTKYVGLESYQNIKFHFTSSVVGSEKENTARPGARPWGPRAKKNKTKQPSPPPRKNLQCIHQKQASV